MNQKDVDSLMERNVHQNTAIPTEKVLAEELAEKLMDVFINTPQIHRSYVIHGEVHAYSFPDTDTIRRKVLEELIKTWRPE